MDGWIVDGHVGIGVAQLHSSSAILGLVPHHRPVLPQAISLSLLPLPIPDMTAYTSIPCFVHSSCHAAASMSTPARCVELAPVVRISHLHSLPS